MESVRERLGAAPAVSLLVAAGLLSLFAYGWIALRYPLATSLQTPRAGWFVSGQADWPTVAAHLAVYALLCVLYGFVLWLGNRQPTFLRGAVPGATVVLVWLLTSAILLAATPSGDSHDIYDYLYRGRLLTEQGVSPLAFAPSAAPRLAFYDYTAWKNHVDTYGPLWEYASGGVALAVRGWLTVTGQWPADGADCPASPSACRVLMAYVTGYRLLANGLVGLTGWLIFALVRRQKAAFAVTALAAWLWNPLVVLGTGLGAHNDALMLVLLLGSLWAWQRRRWLGGLLLLGLATHVKLTALIWGPVYAFWLWRQMGWRRALGWGVLAGAILLPLSWLLYQPLGGWETLARMLGERMLYVANSPSQLVDRLLPSLGYHLPKESVLFAIIRLPSYLSVLLGILLPVWLIWRAAPADETKATPRLWVVCTAAALLYLAVGSFWFQHWYVMWVAAPAALLPWRSFTRWLLPLFCWGALASNIIADGLSRLPVMVISPAGLTALVVAMIWLPGMGGALLLWVRRSRQPKPVAET